MPGNYKDYDKSPLKKPVPDDDVADYSYNKSQRLFVNTFRFITGSTTGPLRTRLLLRARSGHI